MFWVTVLAAVIVIANPSCRCSAFVVPTKKAMNYNNRARNPTTNRNHHPPTIGSLSAHHQPWGIFTTTDNSLSLLLDGDNSVVGATSLSFLTTPNSWMILAAARGDDIAFDEAFTDTVDFTDTPFVILGAVATILVIVLVGLKALSSKMDEAIGQVLMDFESTMKQRHPSRWQKIQNEDLAGLTGDARDIQLLKVMETMQERDPEFMLIVKEQMPQR